jgi:LysR family transcriptional regulator, hydrogen peroxide-inducible genes activator
MLSLKQLRYLDAIARHGHFGKAAAHCAVTQPALSMQIQELEQELGIQLVERRRQGAQLTPAGREVARRAQRVLNEVRDIGDFARQCHEPLSAPIRLGVVPTVAPYVLPALLPLVREDYPHLVLQVRETHTQQLLAELNDGTLDLLLLALPVEHPEVETLRLAEDRFLLAMPPGRKLARRVQATPELFEHDRLLLLEEGHCLRDQALAFCHLRRVEGVDTFGASSLSTLVQMVANGMGLTFLPEISIGIEAMGGRVSIGRFADPEPARTLGLAWRATCPRKQDFIALGELVADAVQLCQRPAARVVAGRRARKRRGEA